MEIIDRAGITPDRIKIEITERVLIEENSSVNNFLKNMSKRGMRFCLDDFGVGYSNVEVMLRVPLDVIKLDRSLVRAGMRSSSHSAFLGYLISGFTGMGKDIVAEGVETAEQLDFIRDCGCSLIQGYYFARPMTEDKLGEFLADQ